MSDTTELIEQALSKPKKVEIDDQVVEQQSLSDLIAADKYLASKKIASANRCPLRFYKMEAGGAV